MRWAQCFTSTSDNRVLVPRFGHTAVAVDAKAHWGTDLIVAYGGVGAHQSHQVEAQTALGDVVVLQVESETWTTPDLNGTSNPGARAFHCAVAVGRKVYVFGGHILTFDQDQNKKRRVFYNDVWCLDTVSAACKHRLCTIHKWRKANAPTLSSTHPVQLHWNQYQILVIMCSQNAIHAGCIPREDTINDSNS